MAEGADRKRPGWLIVLAVVLVLVAVGVGIIVIRGRSSAAASVTLVPKTSAGADPFTASVQVGPVSDFPANVQAIAASKRKTLTTDATTGALAATGTAPGLYGGSGDVHVCDAAKLVSFLAVHPDKAAAWAGVLGIPVSGIKAYVAGLTPVVLTSDTLVGNHGFANGQAFYETSVLQAGTAVMVDATGLPRVKCNCGNPLTEPEPLSLDNADLHGTPWTGYSPATVAVVHPGKAGNGFTVVNTGTGDPYRQPRGTGGTAPAGEWVAARFDESLSTGQNGQTTGVPLQIVASSDGARWSSVGSFPVDQDVDQLVYAGGKWVAIGRYDGGDVGSATKVWTSTDLKSWTQVSTISAVATSLSYGNGRWVAGGVSYTNGSTVNDNPPAVSFTSTDLVHWTTTTLTTAASSGTRVAFGNGRWLAAVTPQGSAATNGIGSVTFYRSSDGTSWTPTGASAPTTNGPSLAFGHGEFLRMTDPTVGAIVVDASPDGVAWTRLGTADLGSAGNLAYGTSKWLELGALGGYRTDTFTSLTGRTWIHVSSQPQVSLNGLGFGPVPKHGAGTVSTTVPSTVPATTSTIGGTVAPAPASLANALLPAGTCPLVDGTPGPAIQLSNGSGESGSDMTSPSFVGAGLLAPTVTTDLNGDGVQDRVILVACGWGGSANITSVVVLDSTPAGGLKLAVPALTRTSGKVQNMTLQGSTLVLTEGVLGPNDPLCCPSQTTTERWTANGSTWTHTG